MLNPCPGWDQWVPREAELGCRLSSKEMWVLLVSAALLPKHLAWALRSFSENMYRCTLVSVMFYFFKKKKKQGCRGTEVERLLLLLLIASVVSDSVQPQRLKPTRLPRPWDSPGKNTGVGCHFLLQCRKVKSEREVAQSCLTLSDPMDYSLPGSSIPWDFPGKSTGVGCHLKQRPQNPNSCSASMMCGLMLVSLPSALCLKDSL